MEKGPRSTDANRIGGDVHGAAVLAGTIHGGVHITVTGAEAEQGSPLAPAEDDPALPGLPTPVRFLLRAQVDTARKCLTGCPARGGRRW